MCGALPHWWASRGTLSQNKVHSLPGTHHTVTVTCTWQNVLAVHSDCSIDYHRCHNMSLAGHTLVRTPGLGTSETGGVLLRTTDCHALLHGAQVELLQALSAPRHAPLVRSCGVVTLWLRWWPLLKNSLLAPTNAHDNDDTFVAGLAP